MLDQKFWATNANNREVAWLMSVVVAYAAIAGTISWIGFAGYRAKTDALELLVAAIWPMIALLASAAIALMIVSRMKSLAALLRQGVEWLGSDYRLAFSILMIITALLLISAVVALRGFPNSGDEYAYIFEARTLSAGRLWDQPPPAPDVFASWRILLKDGKWVGQYPPGWPIIIAGFISLDLPAYLAAPAVALTLLFCFTRLALDLVGRSAALAAAALLTCCPFFIFNGASYFSNLPAALFSVLFVFCGVRFRDTAGGSWALAAGAAFGFLFNIRPFTAFLVLIPCAVELLRRAGPLHYARIGWFLVGCLPFAIGFLLYNYAITGNPFLEPYPWGYPSFQLGLQPITDEGGSPSLRRLIWWTATRFIELAEWTSPLFCLLYAVAVLWKLRFRHLAFYDFILPLFVLAYFLFPAIGGNRYGPRYYFEAYPFMVLTVISAATAWLGAWRNEDRARAMAAAIAGVVIMGLVAYPALAYQYRLIVNERMELYDLAKQSGLSNAIVVIGAPTGSTYSDDCSGCSALNQSTMDPKDLTRVASLAQNVLYVLDIPSQYCALTKAFPGRALFRFEREDDNGAGRIVPIKPNGC